MMDAKAIERAADKLLAVFSDGSMTGEDFFYVAMYLVMKARTDGIVYRVIEFSDHVKYEKDRQDAAKEFSQDTLF
jgi:hypothetical protein